MYFYYILNIVFIILLVYVAIGVVYFFIQERFIFVPIYTGAFARKRLKLPYEERVIETPNAGLIHGYLFKVENPKAVVFYLHGNTGGIARWQYMAEDLAKMGMDVFLMDYRGYGKSKGKRNEAIMHRDVEYCFDFIIKEYDLPIVVYGRSLGCAFATRLASRRKIDKLVLETPFNNMFDTAHFYFPFLPSSWLLRYRFRSDIYIRQVKCPVHIFHGTNDIIVPYSLARKLYESAKKANVQVSFTAIKRGKHSNLAKFPLFSSSLKKFLNS